MFNDTEFYSELRKSKLFGPTFDTNEFKGVQEIIKDTLKAEWPVAYTAYALATAFHETAGTMQPIKEYGGTAYYTKLYDITGRNPQRARSMGNTNPGDGAKYCGRGYVQLTWKVNYQRAERILGVPLTINPDLALDPDIASDIMIQGMENGWFTGKKMSNYFTNRPATKADFIKARWIINGQDKADLIANYALIFQNALIKGNW